MRTSGVRAMPTGAARVLTVLLAVVLALVLGYATKAYAAPGDLDASFDGDGKLTASFSSNFEEATGLVIQSDGRIVVSSSDSSVVRFESNGTADTDFGTNGRVITSIGIRALPPSDLVIQTDGKILVAGIASNGSNWDLALARYNADGSPDDGSSNDSTPGDAFGTNGSVMTDISTSHDFATAVALQTDGKIVVAGYSGTNGNEDIALARYDANGTPDMSFDTDGKLTTDFGTSGVRASDLVIQSDGKIVMAGFVYGTGAIGGRDFALARYNTDGSLDTNSDGDPATHFDTDGKVTTDFGSANNWINALAIQGTKIVAAGASNAGNQDFALARYNADGTLDTNSDGDPATHFDTDGIVATDIASNTDFDSGDEINDLVIQTNGKIVVAGTVSSRTTNTDWANDFALARYGGDGALDPLFSADGKLTTDFGSAGDVANALALQSNGRIMAAGKEGDNTDTDFALARYYGGDDATPPTVSAPVQRLLPGSALATNNNVFIRLSWSGNDTGSGLAHYQLQQKIGTGSYTSVPLSPLTATTKTLSLSPNKTYQFRVRALDNNGNWSAWKTASRFTVDLRQENGVGVSYPSGTWKAQSVSSASGGAVKYATTKDATARFTFRGRNVAWVAPKSTTRGQAEVWLDGVKLATVDLRSATAQARKLVFVKNGLNPSVTHKLEVKVLGTPGRPRVDVDAFAVLR